MLCAWLSEACLAEFRLAASEQVVVDAGHPSDATSADGDAPTSDATVSDADPLDSAAPSDDAGTLDGATPPIDASVDSAPACDGSQHLCDGACYPNSDPPTSTDDTCVIGDSFAIFVSSNGTSDGGTMEAPLNSISAGISAAGSVEGPGRVYVCGSFSENVNVSAIQHPVTVYGGCSCSAIPWTYSASTVATIAPEQGTALVISSPTQDIALFNLDVIGPNEPADSGVPSIGAFVSAGDSGIVFNNCSISSGNGGNGAPGAVAAPYGSLATSGLPASGISRGGECALVCPTGTTVGGSGGAAGITGTPGPGLPGSALPEVPKPLGDGGVWQSPNTCENGAGGGNGAEGTNGTTVPLVVTLSGAGIVESGGTGGAGDAGGAAQGGGGGSGGRTFAPDAGGGGGGACGGCGGPAGTGGTHGGSSIALALFGSTNVQLIDCSISAGAGGAGGAGADGDPGQLGGIGGLQAPPGCPGGNGGTGGAGGGGAGGAGGHSYGIAYSADAGPPQLSGATTVTCGASGDGGAGGTAGDDAGAALGGPSGNCLSEIGL